MRALLLLLSRQAFLRRWMETSPLWRKLSSRFVAGETLADALAVARRLNASGISVTIDRVGESVTSLDEAATSCEEYLKALDEIHAGGLDANVSIKLTQFGLDIDEAACRANVERLVKGAAEYGSFVRVDMESSAYTDRTLALVSQIHERHGSVGAVIQACLFRSEQDARQLCRQGIRVRLCKGAYLESPRVAFRKKADTDRNYVRLMKELLDSGVYPAIATHDEAIIAQTKEYAAQAGISSSQFEFQMLYGIRRDLQRRLVDQHYRLRLYVPYGKAWYPYFMRRLAERPANVIFVLRNLLR